MKRIIFPYGAAAGLVIIGSITLPMLMGAGHGTGAPEWVGYLVMLVALSLIFLGIKRYRDHDLGGVIRFSTGVVLGLGITLLASVIYVAAWEVHLSMTDYAFIDDYTASVIASKEAQGLEGPALQAEVENMDRLKARYAKLSYRLPITFLEIFPVGLLITLLSAALLRKSEFLPARA